MIRNVAKEPWNLNISCDIKTPKGKTPFSSISDEKAKIVKDAVSYPQVTSQW